MLDTLKRSGVARNIFGAEGGRGERGGCGGWEDHDSGCKGEERVQSASVYHRVSLISGGWGQAGTEAP